MVTNLTAKAKAKWAEVVTCRSIPEKIRLMREFISLCPKHKGTSKLLANVKRRIATLEREMERAKARKRGGHGGGFSIPKEGAGQIVILGGTKVGRSSLLASLTNAEPEVSSIPYTTQRPVLGMLQYQDIQFQLIETPALVEGAAEGRMEGPRILGLARNADGLILMVDLTQGSAIQFETLRSELEKSGVLVERPEGFVDIERRSFGSGVQVVGGGVLVDCTVDDIRRLLSSYRINSARVRIRGKVSLDDIEDSLFSSTIYKPTMIIANKIDVEGVEKDLFSLEEVIKRNIPLFSVSCKSKQGLEKIGEHLFRMLKIIRVYSKEPSAKEPSKKPMIVEEGSRVIDVARKLHSELYRRFKYARIWGPSAKYPGERVGQEHMMMDGDILEVH